MTNKELSRRIFDEIYTKGRLGMIEDTHDEHCKLRDPSRETIRQYVKSLRDGFPDFAIEVERQIVETDLVASQIVCHGTNDGPFMGLEPTHKKVHVRCIAVQRFRDDKIVEADVMWDVLGLLNQLGVEPAQALYAQMMATAKGEKVKT